MADRLDRADYELKRIVDIDELGEEVDNTTICWHAVETDCPIV